MSFSLTFKSLKIVSFGGKIFKANSNGFFNKKQENKGKLNFFILLKSKKFANWIFFSFFGNQKNIFFHIYKLLLHDFFN